MGVTRYVHHTAYEKLSRTPSRCAWICCDHGTELVLGFVAITELNLNYQVLINHHSLFAHKGTLEGLRKNNLPLLVYLQ